ncbi:MAG: alpha/beta fold hydrolase [Actinobacteria bacterium]|nr:alpha/beta fold hydrolase [Actinomycetota bacterium]
MPDAFRTPDSRFVGLPGWDLEPRYTDWEGLRLAWYEAGPEDGHPVVLVHGEPTWSYLYRKYLGPLTHAGFRVILADHVGFGRSDKPTDRDWYDYDRLVDAFTAAVAAAAPTEPVTLVVHDWGGPIGLRWAMDHQDQVARIVMHDTGLYASGARVSEGLQRWLDHVREAERLDIRKLMSRSTESDLRPEVVAAYEAPFPTDASQAGAVALPLLIPTSDEHPSAPAMIAANEALLAWEKPLIALWGADDPLLPPFIGEAYAAAVPGGVGCETFPRANHFLQEDAGDDLAPRIVRFIAET